MVIFDTLSLLTDDDEPFTDFTQRWAGVLEPLGPIALIAGSALGGAVVQGLLATAVGRQAAQALLISSPTRADKILDRRLGAMADLASAGDVDTALMLLDQWVLPAQAKPAARQPASAATADEQAGRRLDQGFRLLNELNVEPQVSAWPGRLLSIFGESSQLVRATNVSFRRPRSIWRWAFPVRACVRCWMTWRGCAPACAAIWGSTWRPMHERVDSGNRARPGTLHRCPLPCRP